MICSLCSGLEADQKVLAAHGCYAMTATTALTAQNTTGVKGIHVIPASFVEQQIEACIEDVGVDVVKTGSLYTRHLLPFDGSAWGVHRILCL